jgi:hypothetical protein
MCRALSAAVAMLAVACVATAPATPARAVVVSGPPPDPIAEERPASPGAHAVWVPGYWHWTGIQYAWIPGHWENPPPGAAWAAPRYTSREGTYFYEPGGWMGGHAPASGTAKALR